MVLPFGEEEFSPTNLSCPITDFRVSSSQFPASSFRFPVSRRLQDAGSSQDHDRAYGPPRLQGSVKRVQSEAAERRGHPRGSVRKDEHGVSCLQGAANTLS